MLPSAIKRWRADRDNVGSRFAKNTSTRFGASPGVIVSSVFMNIFCQFCRGASEPTLVHPHHHF
jgi:hypothetical protein